MGEGGNENSRTSLTRCAGAVMIELQTERMRANLSREQITCVFKCVCVSVQWHRERLIQYAVSGTQTTLHCRNRKSRTPSWTAPGGESSQGRVRIDRHITQANHPSAIIQRTIPGNHPFIRASHRRLPCPWGRFLGGSVPRTVSGDYRRFYDKARSPATGRWADVCVVYRILGTVGDILVSAHYCLLLIFISGDTIAVFYGSWCCAGVSSPC